MAILPLVARSGCKVHNILATKGEKVVIVTNSPSDAANLKEKLQGAVNVVEEAGNRRAPRAIVFDVPVDLAEDASFLEEAIRGNLEGDEHVAKLQLTKPRGSAVDAVVNVTFETDGPTLRRLEQQGRLFIGNVSCIVREDLNTGLCFRCGLSEVPQIGGLQKRG